ncbi:MAG: hypothetical protein E2577_11080 [Starkeya sp.]|nr:hypothetical protein [Starkeya sp.]
MALYVPIPLEVPIKCSLSDIIRLSSDGRRVVAYFFVPHDDNKALKVVFENIYVMRMCDEHVLNLEDYPNREGLVGENFLYRMERADFLLNQPAVKQSYEEDHHFRCVTGSTCLDVIADEPPAVTMVPRENAA